MSELLYNTVPNKYLNKVFAFLVTPVQNIWKTVIPIF